MKISLQWVLDPTATYRYAGWRLPTTEPKASSIDLMRARSEAVFLAEQLKADGKNPDDFWQAMMAQTAGLTTEHRYPAAHAWVAPIEYTAKVVWDNVESSLPARKRPIQEQWEARGPGMLTFSSKNRKLQQLGIDFATPREIPTLLLEPIFHGGGFGFSNPSVVGLEAMLINTSSLVPEVVRLYWYVLQSLNDRVDKVLLAIAALHAGAAVELCELDRTTLEEAWLQWELPDRWEDHAELLDM